MTITQCPEAEDDLAMRAVLGVARSRTDRRAAERAFLEATQDLTLCGAAAWERMRQGGTTAEKLHVELQHTRLLLREARDHAEILAARLERVGPRRRPHYSPPLRFRILEHRKKYLLTVEETARRFLVAPQTIYNWIAEMRRDPDATTVGSKIVPVPPVKRYALAVRRLVQQMKEAGFGGKKRIAETLLRNCWTVSPRTVGRILKEKLPPPPPEPDEAMTRPSSVRGDHPNHLWLQDITEIPTLFPFFPLHLMVVLDGCSRLPLAATLRLTRPSAAMAVVLLAWAIRNHGCPRHLVVDQGTQCTANEYRDFVKAEKDPNPLRGRRRGPLPRAHRPHLQDAQGQLEPASDPALADAGHSAPSPSRPQPLRLRPTSRLARGIHANRGLLRHPGTSANAGCAAAGRSGRPGAEGPLRLRVPRPRTRSVPGPRPQSRLSRSAGMPRRWMGAVRPGDGEARLAGPATPVPLKKLPRSEGGPARSW